jgi:ATP:ADP antiporter, AAA family
MGILQKTFNLRREELLPVLLAALFFFCVLTALMLLRPAREALGMQRGIEAVRWLFIGTALVTLLVNPIFGWLVSRFRRLTFIAATYLFFAFSLCAFWVLLTFAPEAVGIVSGQIFYLWFSVFNLFVTMVFWALMADRFTLEQSKRFFALIAVGGTLGAIFGPWLASVLAEPLGTPNLLLVAVGFLLLAIVAAWSVARIQPESVSATDGATNGATIDPSFTDRTIIGGSAWQGFRAVFRSSYLMGMAAYVVILAIMLTFIYFTRLQMVAAVATEIDLRTVLFARIDLITQITTLILQAIVAGHLMKRVGVHFTLAILPLTVALGFVGLAIFASFAALIVLEATVRAVQRAIMRPARETLYTVVNREDKYKSKAFIDTFVYRGGDVIGAQTEGMLGRLGLGLAALASIAVPMALVWGILGIWLGREQQRRALAEQQRAYPSIP